MGDGAASSAGLEAACADRDSNGHAPADRPRHESYRSIASSHCACKRNASRSAGLTRIAFSTRIWRSFPRAEDVDGFGRYREMCSDVPYTQ